MSHLAISDSIHGEDGVLKVYCRDKEKKREIFKL
jgi:hypothetical protein